MKRLVLMTLTATAAVFSAQALSQDITTADVLEFAPGPQVVSAGDSTNKVKILRTPDGTLFAIYGAAQDVSMLFDGNKLVWDAKGQATRKPYDIVIKYSTNNGDTWSAPLNIDNTAKLSSAQGILVQVGPPMLDPLTGTPDLADPKFVQYPGDSDKPNVFNVGNNIIVTWNGKYCPVDEVRFPGEAQRFVVYPELNGITVPYSCQYVSRLVWNSTTKAFAVQAAWGNLPYKTERLSSGMRDAKQDANRGSMYAFVANWQEDPQGLRMGEADGPGDGASGAIVTHGTDIWYSRLDVLNLAGTGVDPAKFVNNAWTPAVRITKNVFLNRPLEGNDVALHPAGAYDHGQVGASRPNIGQIDDSVIIAYEETKGTEGWDDGKYIRYHAFKYNLPPVGGEHGCIVSEPWENARRVRFLTQSLTPTNPVPLVMFYKQGNYTTGGPSDIMLRRAVGGFMPEHLQPAVDVANCRASIMDGVDPMYAIVNDQPAMNFSGARALGGVPGTGQMGEFIDTESNYLENSLAHRGMMRGNLMLIGFSWVPDIYRFQYLNDQTPYNFYVRRSEDGGATWTDAVNLTPRVTAASGYTVKEPRIVPTPASGPACATNPTDCQDGNVIYVGYGMQENVYSQSEEASDIDIYMMASFDGGKSFSAEKPITAGDALGSFTDETEDFETQVKLRPDGRASYTVWSGYAAGLDNAMFRRGAVIGDTEQVITVQGSKSQLTVLPATGDAIVSGATWYPTSDYPAPPEGFTLLPYGVLEFKVTSVALGGSVDVVLSFAEPLPASTLYWKFGMTPDDLTAHWYTVPATIDGNTLTYTLTDGLTGDEDLEVNGQILDPGAPGLAVVKVKPPKVVKPPKLPKPPK
jgi:hypothetical protein